MLLQLAIGIKMPSAAGGGRRAAGGGAMTMAVKHCVTKEQAEKRQPPQTDEDRRQRCEQKDVKVSGNTTTWKIECTDEQKMTGTGPTTMKQSYSGKWLAAVCK